MPVGTAFDYYYGDEHIAYVFDSLVRSPTDIRNIRAYLLTALYNAPVTINGHHQAEVRRDWGH